MGCGGRFKKVEGGGLPPVTNYNFPKENTAVRGPNNVKFRFEEVSSESTYLFEQKNINGDLEEFGGTSGEVVVQLGSESNTTSYTGWVALGDIVVDIPDTGREFKSSEFVGVTYSDFTARSLDKKHSVALIGRGGGSTYSNIAAVFQSGLSLANNERYQVYLEMRTFAGTGMLSYWLEGYTGDYSISDAYNGTHTVAVTTGDTWGTARPANGFVDVSSGATSVSFEINTSSFPGAAPTNYALWVAIQGVKADTVIGVDNIYIDQYMKKDAFTNVILPSGYLLQFTPDLGWSDALSMFEERDSRSNPHLVTLGPYTFSSGNLIDKGDGSVEVVLSSSDADKVFKPQYTDYLWRAIAVSDNGEIGEGGFPVRFKYVGQVLDKQFQVLSVSDDPREVVKTIRGSRTGGLSILVNGSEHSGVSYPSADRWALTYVTKYPEETIGLQAVDSAGALSSTIFVTLKTAEMALKEKRLWNEFDEFALLVGTPRLPGEDNQDLADRLKDAVANPGSHLIDGIAYGASRELGLEKNLNAIKARIDSKSDASEALLEVTSFGIRLHHPSYIHKEISLVHPVYKTVDLEKDIYDDPVDIYVLGSKEPIPDSRVSVFDDNGEKPLQNKLLVDFDPALGELVEVVYRYYLVFKYSDYPTLGELLLAIQLAAPEFRLSLDTYLGGAETSEGLILGEYALSIEEDTNIPWSPVVLRRVSDREFKESFRNEDGTIWNSKIYKWIRTLQSTVAINWGNAVLDKDYWDAEDNKNLSFDHVLSLLDPPISRYIDQSGNVFDAETAFAMQYKDPSSGQIVNTLLSYKDFVPGVASLYDLKPGLFVTRSGSPEIKDEESNIVDGTSNPFITLFSGSIS